MSLLDELYYGNINPRHCICYYDKNYTLPRRKNSRRDLVDYQPKSGTRMAFDYANKRNLMIYNVFEWKQQYWEK